MKTYEEILNEFPVIKSLSDDYPGIGIDIEEIAKRYAREALKENTPSLDDVNKMFAEKHPEYNTRSRLHTIDLDEVKLIDVLYDYYQVLKESITNIKLP